MSARVGPATGAAPPSTVAVSRRGVVRGEWIKLRSLRSTVLTTLAAAASMGGMALVGATDFGTDWERASVAARTELHPMNALLSGWFIAQVLFGVIGALAVTSEYASRSITATLAAVPRRLPVLVAKVLVPATVAFAVMVPATFAAVVVARVLLPDEVVVDLGAPGTVRAVVGVGVAMAAVAAIGAGLGFLVRSTAGAIGILVVVLFVLPGLVAGLSDDVARVLPGGALESLMTVEQSPDEAAVVAWPVGLALLGGYVTATVAAAAWVLRRRDA